MNDEPFPAGPFIALLVFGVFLLWVGYKARESDDGRELRGLQNEAVELGYATWRKHGSESVFTWETH